MTSIVNFLQMFILYCMKMLVIKYFLQMFCSNVSFDTPFLTASKVTNWTAKRLDLKMESQHVAL